jgi:subtilisin family serine protease
LADSLNGRALALFNKGRTQDGIAFLRREGLQVAVTELGRDIWSHNDVPDVQALVLHKLGGVVLTIDAEQASRWQQEVGPTRIFAELRVSDFGKILVPPLEESPFGPFGDDLEERESRLKEKPNSLDWPNDPNPTWGIEVTGVRSSEHTGASVRVAFLDTGLDRTFIRSRNGDELADFEGRVVARKAFGDAGASTDDGHGHGTHTTGTAAGVHRNHGIAGESLIHVARVTFGSLGSETSSEISVLEAVNWALGHDCSVISLQVVWPLDQNAPFNPLWEEVAGRCLNLDSLMIAGVGNDSTRSAGLVTPARSPANCPSVLSVGAISQGSSQAQPQLYSKSNGGKVDIAAPGEAVFSTLRRGDHGYSNGTSMAAAHVVGIAALYVGAEGVTGARLRDRLLERARQLGLCDTGAGLVQAP